MRLRDLPNIISALRILLVMPIVVCLLKGLYGWSLLLFLIAGASDGIDGLLARRFGWTSRLGSILDPLGDKLLMVAVYLVLGGLGQLPWWLVAAVILRDVVIITGALSYHAIIEEVSMEPLKISKLNTGVQVVLVLLIMTGLALPAISIPEWLPQGMIYLAFATTVLSGLSYVLGWSRRAARVIKRRHD